MYRLKIRVSIYHASIEGRRHCSQIQDEVFPTSDARSRRSVAAQEHSVRAAAHKRVTRPVTAQAAAQQKRTVQGAVYPTSDADTDF